MVPFAPETNLLYAEEYPIPIGSRLLGIGVCTILQAIVAFVYYAELILN